MKYKLFMWSLVANFSRQNVHWKCGLEKKNLAEDYISRWQFFYKKHGKCYFFDFVHKIRNFPLKFIFLAIFKQHTAQDHENREENVKRMKLHVTQNGKFRYFKCNLVAYFLLIAEHMSHITHIPCLT